MFEDKDYEILEKFFDGRYRKIEDCEVIMGSTKDDIIQIKISQAKGNTKLTILISILCAIAAALIPVCVKLLLKL